ncbi:Asp-tRNA(Asn)/Glu-tRNA(Gln) amidotransferase subunit GatC [Patescibacteria group bacterium]|nr:Asp-tRNA(Asn)/Glu-tRNA(Gln) amidotransferase subunit GatC [Patescibacteria group bacterium]MBU1916046.1 Asp-tRNA(Asn)/Glu-tRNA(Gln) amidotransferase subunit GatC [Patescibacteria group bacterium]
MSLTPEEVDKIADLARLELSDEERSAFRYQLSSILDYVGKLSEVDIEGVEPMSHSIPVFNVLREDDLEICNTETRSEIIASFPEKEGDLLKVKAVFE